MKKNYIVIAIVVLAIIVVGGGLLNKNKTVKNETPTPASSNSTTNSPSTPSNSSTGEVTISGALNKTFKTARIQETTLGNSSIIYLAESDAAGITLRFTVGTKPGTYQIEAERKSDKPGVYAMYQVANDNAGSTDYLSNNGTLTLTEIGSVDSNFNVIGKFSGQFQFTAVDLGTSKTIDVKGSFADVKIGQNQ